MSLLRFAAIAGAMVLFGAALPAHAMLSMNSITSNSLTNNSLTNNSLTNNSLTNNSLTSNAVTQNALAATGSAVAELNGVAVEEVVLPQATRP